MAMACTVGDMGRKGGVALSDDACTHSAPNGSNGPACETNKSGSGGARIHDVQQRRLPTPIARIYGTSAPLHHCTTHRTYIHDAGGVFVLTSGDCDHGLSSVG